MKKENRFAKTSHCLNFVWLQKMFREIGNVKFSPNWECEIFMKKNNSKFSRKNNRIICEKNGNNGKKHDSDSIQTGFVISKMREEAVIQMITMQKS